MKVCLLLLFIIPTLGLAQDNKLSEFNSRLEVLKEFKLTIIPSKEKLIEFKDKMKSYEHEKLILMDKKQIEKSLKVVDEVLSTIKHAESSFYLGSIERNINKYKELLDFKKLYESKKEEYNKKINSPGRSKRFKKFIEYHKNREYTKTSIAKAALFKEEKKLANEIEELSSYLAMEENLYKWNEKEIIEYQNKIEKSFKTPEGKVLDIEDALSKSAEEENIFTSIQKAHENLQFDVTISEYESGMFNCKDHNSPKIMRYKNFPNLIALETKGSVKSILKIDPNNPNKKEFIYACKEFSSLGGCLENRKKEICKIKSECANALEKMEKSFDLKKEFIQNKDGYLDFIINNSLYDIDNNQGNPLYYWNEKDLLGTLKLDDLKEIMKSEFDYAKSLNPKSLNSFIDVMTKRLKKKKSQALYKYKTGYENKAMEYLYNSLVSSLEGIKNRDKLQLYIADICTEGEFCKNFKDWDMSTRVFNEKEQVTNLTPEECPRIVLRFTQNSRLISNYKCGANYPDNGLKGINELNNSSEKIIKMIKN